MSLGFFISTVVGYANTSTTAKKYNCYGPSFITTGNANGQFMLKNFIPTGFSWENDELRILNPNTCGTLARLVYFTEADGMGVTGWFDFDTQEEYNDKPLAIGTGFLTSYGTQTEVGIQSSGEVYGDAVTVDCRGNKYQSVPNPLPRRIKFSDVTPTGFNWENDELRIVKNDTCGTKARLVYFTEGDGMGVTGWFDFDTQEEYNDKYIEIGDGFLLSSGSKAIQITFPKAISDAK